LLTAHHVTTIAQIFHDILPCQAAISAKSIAFANMLEALISSKSDTVSLAIGAKKVRYVIMATHLLHHYGVISMENGKSNYNAKNLSKLNNINS
jgi:hypothetical protein